MDVFARVCRYGRKGDLCASACSAHEGVSTTMDIGHVNLCGRA